MKQMCIPKTCAKFRTQVHPLKALMYVDWRWHCRHTPTTKPCCKLQHQQPSPPQYSTRIQGLQAFPSTPISSLHFYPLSLCALHECIHKYTRTPSRAYTPSHQVCSRPLCRGCHASSNTYLFRFQFKLMMPGRKFIKEATLMKKSRVLFLTPAQWGWREGRWG